MSSRATTTSKRHGLPEGWSDFYTVIKKIPRGRVTTYGAVAALAGRPRSARHVGFALAALIGEHHALPWQRVLGARSQGYAAVSIRDPVGAALQRELLEGEGVRFDRLGRVDLAEFGWGIPSLRRARRAAAGRAVKVE